MRFLKKDWPFFTVFLVILLALCYRLWEFNSLYGSALVTGDRLDTYTPIFYHYSFWEGFVFQHGPVRLGLVYPLFNSTSALSHWDARWDGYLQIIIYAITALVALRLLIKVRGKCNWMDLSIPVIFATFSSVDTVFSNPFFHGTLPLITLGFCFVYVIDSLQKRALWLVVLIPLAGFTGFGMICLMVIALIEGVFWLKATNKTAWYRWLPAVLIVVTLAYIFLTNEARASSVTQQFEWINGLKHFVALTSNLFLNNPKNVFLVVAAAGWGVLVLMVLLLIYNKKLLMYGPELVIVVLLLVTPMVFNLLNVYGRANLGIGNALASRYVPVGMVLVFGVYWLLQRIQVSWLKTVCSILLLILCVRAQFTNEALVNYTIQRAKAFEQFETCVLAEDDLGPCVEKAVALGIHPKPEETQLLQKMNYLKENKLSIFREP